MKTIKTPPPNLLAERYPTIAYHKDYIIAVPSWEKKDVYVLPGHIETTSEELVANGFTPKSTMLWPRFWIEVRT